MAAQLRQFVAGPVAVAHDMSGWISPWNVRFLGAAWEQDACLEASMNGYPRAAVERMMKIQEVILRAMAKKITWWQAAEIIGITDRQMRRRPWREWENVYYGVLGPGGGALHIRRVR